MGEHLLLVEGVVAQRQAVGPGGEELLGDGRGEAEARGGVLGVHRDEIQPPIRAEARQGPDHRVTARAPDDVAEEKKPHQPGLLEDKSGRIRPSSVTTPSNCWSVGSRGTSSICCAA